METLENKFSNRPYRAPREKVINPHEVYVAPTEDHENSDQGASTKEPGIIRRRVKDKNKK